MLDVPKTLYEAAEIDGAGMFQRFFHVTLPSISPVIYFSVITGVIFTFQYFTQAFVISTSNHANLQSSLLLGYPQNSLFFYTTGIYQQGFNFFKTNTASAMAVLLFFVILIITAVFIRVSRSLIYYQGEQ
ncbi:MAG: sugar ABC transporter permease, partial [Micrococcales bacterium]|nr:sugar ABC transporter permease [Micrococcales bacterium]